MDVVAHTADDQWLAPTASYNPAYIIVKSTSPFRVDSGETTPGTEHNVIVKLGEGILDELS
jgi:hypothetical protein